MRSSRTSGWLYSAAMPRGVTPCWSVFATWPPFCSRSSMTWAQPALEASCMAVHFFRHTCSTWAPAAIRSETIWWDPARTAAERTWEDEGWRFFSQAPLHVCCSDLKEEEIRSCCWWCEEKLRGPAASSGFPPNRLSLLKSERSHPLKTFPLESDWKTLKHTTKVRHYFTEVSSRFSASHKWFKSTEWILNHANESFESTNS